MRRIASLAAVLLMALAGCGSGEEGDSGPDPTMPGGEGIPGGADEGAVEVIYEWSEALRRGDIDGAAASFAIPSVAENPPLLVHIDSEAEARLFNESLPCGGRLIRATNEGDFTTATFRLTERPGPGSCGDGTGSTAQAAFVIEDGEIVEWTGSTAQAAFVIEDGEIVEWRRVGEAVPTVPGQSI